MYWVFLVSYQLIALYNMIIEKLSVVQLQNFMQLPAKSLIHLRPYLFMIISGTSTLFFLLNVRP